MSRFFLLVCLASVAVSDAVLFPDRVADCVVTQWSEWSETYGLGRSTRGRRILRYPENGGQPCPDLSQTRFTGDVLLFLLRGWVETFVS